MNQELERKILQLAVERKILSGEDLQKARREWQESSERASGPTSALVELLIEKGLLKRTAVEMLTAEILNSGRRDAGGTKRSDSELGTAFEPITPFTQVPEEYLETFGRYKRLEFVGSGGMAKVYKAYDPTLDRIVALKFVRLESPELTERLMREARAQAKIDHDNVCKIYEVGQVDGRNYIAMQYLPGKNLKEAYANLTTPKKVKILAQVADALHAAHRAGLIHRDMKPSNIMIVQSEDGEPHPYVMDFGLAREVEAHGLTISGQILGTPAYMSPEQAAGKKVDSRTDIYSVGATLYEVVAGKLPFEGDSAMEVLMNVIQKDPQPPRRHQPSVPVDLETIILKSMEKEPDRRYLSGRALAEDLRRFLDGEPVLARRASWTYTTTKKIRKNPVVSALLAAGLVIALSAIVFALFTRYRAAEQNRYANEFNLEAQDIQQRLRYFYSQPAHDVRADEETIRKRLQKIESTLNQEGSAAQGPGKYVLGLGYLALNDYSKAKNYLEEAWNRGNYQVPQVAYAYGLSLVHVYGKEQEEADQLPSAAQREARRKQIENELLKPALQYLSSGRLATETPLYAEALIALLEKRYQDALTKAENALAHMPWLYEADRLQGDAYAALAKVNRDSGKVKEALRFSQNAEKAYGEATRKAPSDLQNYLGMAMLQRFVSRLQSTQTALSPEESFQKAKDACEKALMVRPDSADALKLLGHLYIQRGQQLYEKGIESEPERNKGIEFLRKALAVHPDDPDVLYSLGLAYRYAAVYHLEHGKDPKDDFDASVAFFQKGSQRAPNRSYVYEELGAVYTFRSNYEINRGLDARESVDRAIDSYRKALKINPRDYIAAGILGITYSHRAQLEVEQGKDPHQYFDLAIQSARNSIAINPSNHESYVYLGSALFWKAEYEFNHGVNPIPSLDQSIGAYQDKIKMSPNDGETYANICEADNMKSEFQLLTGMPAENSVQEAIAYGVKGLELMPDLDFAVVTLGISYANLAEVHLKHPNELENAAKRSRETIQSALKINKDYPEAHFTLGRLVILSFQQNPKQGTRILEQARLHLLEALRLNPKYTKARALLAESYLLESERKSAHNEFLERDVEDGLKICDESPSGDPYIQATKAALLFLKARFERNSQLQQEAKRLLDEALRVNGNLRKKYGRFEES